MSMLTPPEKLSVIQQGFSTRWQAMTKRNFPYFPHDYLTRAKIRENTYHFIIQGSACLEKHGKFRKSLHKFRFVTDHISVTHHIISDIITFSITNLHDEMEKSNFLPPTNSYISAPMPPILPTTHQMVS